MSVSGFPYRLATGMALLALAAGGWAMRGESSFKTASIPQTVAAVPTPPSTSPAPKVGPDAPRIPPAAIPGVPALTLHPVLARPPIGAAPPPAPARPAGDLALLKLGLAALAAGDVTGAIEQRNRLRFGSLDHDILTWAIASASNARVPGGEIENATRILAGWPGMDDLRRNIERAALRENASPKDVLAIFADAAPETVEGARILARAHVALGETELARGVLAPFWRGRRLEAATEAAILREFATVLSTADHRARMEYSLYNDRTASAARVAKHAGAEELAKAWTAVVAGARDARKLLDAVPQAQRSAGWSFASARQLRRAGKYKEAAAVVLAAPTAREHLADPDAWWVERRAIAREMLDLKDYATAYGIAAAHASESPAMAADAEFHAGWIALRMLKDPAVAAGHFRRIAALADGAISLSRAHYWLGRAIDAGAAGDARAAYETAATFGTAFYGQLSAQKLGRTAIPIESPSPSEADRRSFEALGAVAALRRFEEAGFAADSDRLYRLLGAELENPAHLALLARMAESRGDHYLALRIGKAAAARGVHIGSLAHPTGAIPDNANISGAGRALAYAIARQESEFRVSAVSGAGAQGLLQLLPDTAADMAKKAGLPFSKVLLTTDAGYNATLGSEFLSEQLQRFSGSYVLTFAGYNAGPKRARDWIQRYGDPRGQSVEDVVDWIERIPFTETRHYVQRVMENYQVYKMQITGRVDIVSDLVNGR